MTRQDSRPTERSSRRKRKRVRSPLARIGIALARVVLIGYACIVAAVVLMEERLVYPGAYFQDQPGFVTTDTAIKTVSYRSTDGLTLPGRLLHRDQSRHLVLFLHGNGTKAKWLDDWIVQLSEQLDATVMAAEYRGYEDNVTPNERGVLEDCFAARDYLCEHYRTTPKQIVLYGRSLGGGCAAALASRDGAKVLVLDRTFDRLYRIGADQYPFLPVRLLMRNRYDSLAKLTAYRGPLIQIHGSIDALIPIECARTLFDSAPSQPKAFIELPSLDHNDNLSRQSLAEIAAKIDEFSP